MNTPVRIAAGVLAFGLVTSAASAQACACGHHHRHHARAARYVAPVRYERRIVREPAYVRAYDSSYYGGGGYYDRAYYGGYYAQPYGYTVVRPRPVIVSYGDGYYWRHHHRHHHGHHYGWDRDHDHDRGHWRD